MYQRAHSDVVTDAYIARKTFDAVIRKASRENLLLDDAGQCLEVAYYAGEDSTSLDRYARFYLAGDELKIDYGQLDPRSRLTTQTVSRNVSNCLFKQLGKSVRMILTLDNKTQTMTVVSSAVMHN